MGVSDTCASVRSQLGVYLTGSIHPADRAVVVRHLTSCMICRAEVADLSALPALLRRPASQAAAEGPGQDPAGTRPVGGTRPAGGTSHPRPAPGQRAATGQRPARCSSAGWYAASSDGGDDDA